MFKMAHEFLDRKQSVTSCLSSESKATRTTANTKSSFGQKKHSKVIKLHQRKHLNPESLQSYGQTRRRQTRRQPKSPKEKVKINSPRAKLFKSFRDSSKKELAFGSLVVKTEESVELPKKRPTKIRPFRLS